MIDNKEKLKKLRKTLSEKREELNVYKEKRDAAKTKATRDKYDTLYKEYLAKTITPLKKKIAKLQETMVDEKLKTVDKTPAKVTEPVVNEEPKPYTVWFNDEFDYGINGFPCGRIKGKQQAPENASILAKNLTVKEAKNIEKQIASCNDKDELIELVKKIRKEHKNDRVLTPLTTKEQKKVLDKNMEKTLKPVIGSMGKSADNKKTANTKVKQLLKDINAEIRSIKEDIEKPRALKKPEVIEDLIARLELLDKQVLKYDQQSNYMDDDETKFSEIFNKAIRLRNFSAM